MTDLQNGLILLIKSAVSGSAEKIPKSFDWQEALKISRKHQILSLIYYGICNSKVNLPTDIKTEFELSTFKALHIDQNQLWQINVISKAFEENSIDFMLLKGAVIKKYYPKTEMRQMSDADILIKTNQYNDIRPIMMGLGFDEKYESNHELVWMKKGALTVELHKSVIPSYNKDYYSYFGNGWQLAKNATENGCKYEMTPEDELIYNFTHMAKHYRDGGIGIRHILDIYICIQYNKKLDFSYIEVELEKLQLLEFFKNIKKTIDVWFNGENPNEKTDFITNYIFSSGSYGTPERKLMASAVKTLKTVNSAKQVKEKRLFDLIFMPYDKMQIKYPFLKKFKILLPIMWIVRWITAILCKRDDIKKVSHNVSQMTAQNIETYQQALNYVGLDFNFK